MTTTARTQNKSIIFSFLPANTSNSFLSRRILKAKRSKFKVHSYKIPFPSENIQKQAMMMFPVLAMLLGSSHAFTVPSSPGIRQTIRQGIRHCLYVDVNGNGEHNSKEIIESSITEPSNEWGIPDSKTLEPFSSIRLDELGNGGRITLVGSGPGDPDLLTVKAFKLLQDPDALVICDRLVSQEILDLVQGEMKVARKMPGCAELAQEEIYWWAHQGLAQGKHVIRLKIGDPFVFGRGAEEIITFRRFGLESKVVPVSFSKVYCFF
jgi:hypothetical protein